MTVRWTEEMDALFTTYNDVEVAKRLGLSRTSVLRRRTMLNIPPQVRRPIQRTDDSIIAKLGTKSDAELGREYGVTRERVRQIRNDHGIPTFELTPDWASVNDRLDVDTDESLAQRLGVSASAVRRHRKDLGVRKTAACPTERQLDSREDVPPDWRNLLGQTSDYSLAKTWKLPAPSVQRLRKKLGRPPIRPRPPIKVNWSDPANVARLGAEPDAKLAQEWGISKAAVAAKRKRLGIPALRRSNRQPR